MQIESQRRGFAHRCVLCLLSSTVSVGYEYESCPDLILWEKRTTVLQGYEIDASKLGGWSLDKHHALNIQSGEWISTISGTRPRCDPFLSYALFPARQKNTHFKLRSLICDQSVRSVNTGNSLATLSLLGSRDAEVKGFKGLHSG